MKQSKIAIIGDLHIGARNFTKSVFNTQMEFFEKQFFPYLLENNITEVINLGDTAHNRNIIDLWILQQFKQRFFQWFEDNKITLHSIIGNHDSYHRNTIETNFLSENLKEFKYCQIYEKPSFILIGKYSLGMIPWITDEKALDLPKKCDIICGHFDIIGMPMMKNIFSHSGHDTKEFKDYKLVFSGHYHTKSKKDNVQYIGTQYQLTWNDFNDDKGFFVLDDKFNATFVANTVSPRYFKLYYVENDGNIELTYMGDGAEEPQPIEIPAALELSKKNYLKLYVQKMKDQTVFDNFYNSLSATANPNYKLEIVNIENIVENYDFTAFEESLNEETSTIEMIQSYIDSMHFEKDIDKDMLIELSKALYREAYNEMNDDSGD